jgi:phenylacetate-CoA ligase
MSGWSIKLFHMLPPPGRSAVASAKGLYLRSQRYGAESDRLTEEALDRELWSRERWDAWQADQLGRLLHRAATRVPYYREHWNERRRRGDQTSWEYLENWPIVEKDTVRERPLEFVADDRPASELVCSNTSGTTGKPMRVYQTRDVMRSWYALFEARWRRWSGLTRENRWAILGGQLVAPVEQTRPPFWVWNAPMRQLYMSSYHLRPDLLEHYLDALEEYGIEYLWGYSSSLHALADSAIRAGRTPLTMRVVLTNAEPLHAYQRESIAAAFQCPVKETYGMEEMVAAAAECAEGALHLWPEVGIVEYQTDGRFAAPGEVGDLLCTGLLNPDFVLIRYRVGDRGAAPMEDGPCACGRHMRVIQCIEGRLDDLLFTRDGRRIGRLDPLFKDDIPLKEAQIIQETLDTICIRYVRAAGFTSQNEASIAARLRQRVGDVQVRFEPVAALERGPNGKLRAVVCKLPKDERQRLLGAKAMSSGQHV